MSESKLSINTIVAIGIGAAVFIILSRFGSIPTFIPNTNVETAYAFLALMAVIYGPVAGLSIGLVGHLLKDLILYGSPWISWIIASGIVGLVIGLSKKRLNVEDGEFGRKKVIVFNIYQLHRSAIFFFFSMKIVHDHCCNLKCHCIFKLSQIKTGTLFNLFQTIDQRVAVHMELA